MSKLRENLKISARAMYDELLCQSSNARILDAESSIIEFTDDIGESHLLFSTSSHKSSSAGSIIGSNKIRTEIVAKNLMINVPSDCICETVDDAIAFLEIHKEIVLKPLDNSGGKGVSTHLRSVKSVRAAYEYGLEFGEKIIAQQHIDGDDLRLLVVAGVCRSAVERRPASVVGDGASTIAQLIERENSSGKRAANSMGSLGLIDIYSAHNYLGRAMNTVLKKDAVMAVVGPANLSLGGTAHEATHLVSAAMKHDAEKIAHKLGLGICGVDFMRSRSDGTHYLIEVNGTPGVNMHNDPFWGTSSNAIKLYVSWLLDSTQTMKSEKKFAYSDTLKLPTRSLESYIPWHTDAEYRSQIKE